MQANTPQRKQYLVSVQPGNLQLWCSPDDQATQEDELSPGDAALVAAVRQYPGRYCTLVHDNHGKLATR